MSDPLTALMHAVQVMNLLKTLIMKTQRERDETATAGYSPMSCPSDRQTDEEFESQEEMYSSCELRRQPLDADEEEVCYSQASSEDEDEVQSLSEIEQCFLKQLVENENAKDCFKKELGNLVRERSSPVSGSTYRGESGLSTSEEEVSGLSSISMGVDTNIETPSKDSATVKDVVMVDKIVGSVPLRVSSSLA